jgi:hypothetical protein
MIARECQTNLQNDSVEVASQTRNKKQKEVQTDLIEDLNNENVKYDEKSLLKFLKKKWSLIEMYFEENEQSTAFTSKPHFSLNP